MHARRLDPGRCPPSHPAYPWLVGRWSAGALTTGRRSGCGPRRPAREGHYAGPPASAGGR